jgi:hypothetical protein
MATAFTAHRASSSAVAAAIIRGASLTRAYPYPWAPQLSSNTSTRIGLRIAAAARTFGLGSSRSLSMTCARLLSSSPTPVKKSLTGSQHTDRSPSQSSEQTPSSDDFKVSFRDLGMTRVTKFVVYAAITVLATMETIFWCKALVSKRSGCSLRHTSVCHQYLIRE